MWEFSNLNFFSQTKKKKKKSDSDEDLATDDSPLPPPRKIAGRARKPVSYALKSDDSDDSDWTLSYTSKNVRDDIVDIIDWSSLECGSGDKTKLTDRCEKMLHKFIWKISKISSSPIVGRDISNNFMWGASYRICQNVECFSRIILKAEIIWNKNLYFRFIWVIFEDFLEQCNRSTSGTFLLNRSVQFCT